MSGTNFRAQISRVFGWWVGELAQLASGWATTTRQPWRGLLVGSGTVFDLYQRQGRGAKHLGRFDLAASADELEEVRKLIARNAVPSDRLILRLPLTEVVATQLYFPAGVSDVLPQVVRNQLERVAPWPAEQVLFAYEPVAGAAGDQQIKVDLWVTERATVERTLAGLANVDLRPGVVDCGDAVPDEPRFNLLASDDAIQIRRRRLVARALATGTVLACLASVLALSAALYLGNRVSRVQRSIQAELQAVVNSAGANQETAERHRALVIEQRRKAPLASIALENLSRALPDDAYLDRLELKPGTLSFSGRAASAASLIAPLEAVEQFGDVRFTAPVTRKANEPLEDFSLSVSLKATMALLERGEP
ncbi:MAG: PilN domain-containing protein [Hyphomicrobium sp.]